MSINEMETFESQQEYVGFWARFGATIIDSLILIAITFPLLHSIYGSQYWEAEEMIVGLPDFLISWVFPLVATILFWVYKSATPGKMALKVKIVDAKTGNAPTTQQSIIRYVGYYISAIPLCLGFLWVGWDSKKQGWHDKLAGTVVIAPKNKGVENVSFSENNT
ncbi:RDD family protein [Thalassotalea nanhaiensis]|uniref:RDD family protein n=1 Tax=Thalassotalea nanhaiensis TaxID=3065648 RepID=A0ABY9TGS8_9GAMM|nr:RDD family protein [Colwelliaceae bacterium SQ345]